MMQTRQFLYVLLFLLSSSIIFGCASVGRRFNHQNISRVKIGELKLEESQNIFGTPYKTAEEVNESGKYNIQRYEHAFADIGTARSRVLILEFLNGSLNAYNFLSSYDEDRTLVDIDRVSEVNISHSTKDDVLGILGKPYGIGICPSTLGDYKDKCSKEKVAEVWSWASQRKLVTMAAGDKNQGSQFVFVSFDADGVAVALNTNKK